MTITMTPRYFIGIDRSDLRLDICVLDRSGSILCQQAIPTTPEDMLAWARQIEASLEPGQHAALCIEQPCSNLLNFFRQFDFLVLHLINPVMLKRYRDTFNIARAKDDKKDAFHLARLLFEKRDLLKAWQPDDPESRRLAILTQKRRHLVGIRVNTTNQLTQLLKDYFPQALQLVGRDLHARLAISFLEKWPTLQSLQKARPSTIRKFYYAHGSRRPGPIEQRLEIIANAVPLCVDPIVLDTCAEFAAALLKQLRALDASIRRFEERLGASGERGWSKSSRAYSLRMIKPSRLPCSKSCLSLRRSFCRSLRVTPSSCR